MDYCIENNVETGKVELVVVVKQIYTFDNLDDAVAKLKELEAQPAA